MNVSARLLKICITLNQYRHVPPLKQMTYHSMLFIKIRGVQFVQTAHDKPNFTLFCLQKQVEMIRHQAVTMQNKWIDFLSITKQLQE